MATHIILVLSVLIATCAANVFDETFLVKFPLQSNDPILPACKLTIDEKAALRRRAVDLRTQGPDYNWLKAEPRVSIAIDRCTLLQNNWAACTQGANPVDSTKPPALDLIKDGVLTQNGLNAQLRLEKSEGDVGSEYVVKFTGHIQAVNIGLPTDVQCPDEDHATPFLQCHLKYCLVGEVAGPGRNGCPADPK